MIAEVAEAEEEGKATQGEVQSIYFILKYSSRHTVVVDAGGHHTLQRISPPASIHGILKYSFRYTVVVGAGGYTLLHRISPPASLNSSTFYFSEKFILSTLINLIESSVDTNCV